MSSHADADVIVVGSGHNGLIAAGYLATAGKRVLVLERNEYPGGGVATLEMTAPGFLSERHALMHHYILGNPVIADDELGLVERYGLEYIHQDKIYGAAFEDGTSLAIYRDRAATIASIERLSPRDAEAYDRFMDLAVPMGRTLMDGFFVPPAPMDGMTSALGSTPVGREILRSMSMSVADVYGEWFEDERVRVMLTRWASEIVLAHPEDLNTGMIAYLALGPLELWGMAVPRGGSSSLARACISCIEDHGGEVRTDVEVTGVRTESGRAVGVRTGDGGELRAADAVLASIHPHLLGDLVEGLDAEIARRAARTKLAPYTGFVIHAALEEPIRFKAGEMDEIPVNTLTDGSYEHVIHAFDELRRGRLPAVPLLGAGCPSSLDPSRAPAGRAVLHLFSMTTRHLADGGAQRWEAIKEEMADRLLDRLSEFTTNFDRDAVIAREIVTPLGHEIDTPSFTGGDITGIAMYSHQMGGMRPTPELSGYAVPGVEGLYLVGPFMHPGGGVCGGGRPVAIKMFEDLGMDFERFGSRGVATV